MDEPQRPQPYTPPAIAWEEPFEPVASAVTCARLPGQGGTCTQAPKL